MSSGPSSGDSAGIPGGSADPRVTRILSDSKASHSSVEELLPLVYEQLRALAQKRLAEERIGHTLQATALVHEAYLRLAGPRDIPWQNRAHFYSAAAEAMRRILLDHAKARGRDKRGGGRGRVDLEVASLEASSGVNQPDYAALDDAIRRLEVQDPRMGRVVHLRFYAGLSVAETALALGVSDRTVKSDWQFARAWLDRELRSIQAGRSEAGDE